MDLGKALLIKLMHRILDWNRFGSAHAAPPLAKRRLILGNKNARARSLAARGPKWSQTGFLFRAAAAAERYRVAQKENEISPLF